jgi:hypothetical protein
MSTPQTNTATSTTPTRRRPALRRLVALSAFLLIGLPATGGAAVAAVTAASASHAATPGHGVLEARPSAWNGAKAGRSAWN